MAMVDTISLAPCWLGVNVKFILFRLSSIFVELIWVDVVVNWHVIAI